MPESERVDAYLDTVRRMEPDIAMVDRDAALTSIAISLKRIADALSAAPGTPTIKPISLLAALAEGPVRKGGRNSGPSGATERPASPLPLQSTL